MILRFLLVIEFGLPMQKSKIRCSGPQIEISIIKSVSEHSCEWLLIYNDDDLTYLDIEINSLKNFIFRLDLSWKLVSKKLLKEILKEIGVENIIWIKISSNSIFYLDAFWYDDWYWKASPVSTLNDFNNGLDIFHDLSSLVANLA